MSQQQTPGRKGNAAEAQGNFTALGGKGAVERTGERARTAAGPDGGDAAEVGDTFKTDPKRDKTATSD